MPELPEVETIRRMIERELVGLTLERVELTLPKLMRDSPLPTLDMLIGHTLLRAERRAKVLVTHWSGDLSLLTTISSSPATGCGPARRAASRLRAPGARSRGHPAPQVDAPHAALQRRHHRLLQRHSAVRFVALDADRRCRRGLAAFRFGPEGRHDGFDREDFGPPAGANGALRSNRRCSISGSSPVSAISTSTRRSIARISTPPDRRTACPRGG